jgi:tRNA (guanine37-N1)-methyltransferase
VPEVLLSGDHARIERWREQNSRERSRERRPDLLRSRDSKGLRAAKRNPEEKA